MKTDSGAIGAWKRRVVAWVVIGLLGVLASIYIQRIPPPDLGFDLAIDWGTRNIFVSSVAPRTPASTAGLRRNDVLSVRDMDFMQRVILSGPTVPTAESLRLDLHVSSNGTTRRVSFTAHPDAGTISSLISNNMVLAGDLLMLAVALAIGLRKPDNRDVRDICGVLLSYAVGNGFYNLSLPSPPLLALITVANLGPILSAILFGRFALRFVHSGRPRSIAVVLGNAIFITACILTMLFLLGAATGRPNPFVLSRWPWTGYFFAESSHYFFARAFGLICGVWAIAVSRGVERQRIAWATGAIALLYGTAVIVQPLVGLGVIPASFDEPIVDVAIFLFPIGLAYAVFKRRILDVGFVINRAAVFSGVSLVLVGSFVLIEWALTDWLQHESHTTSIAVSGLVALALGLSTRYIHRRVESIIDTLLFRKRHEDETALELFAREAVYFNDSVTLLKRTEGILELRADASTVEILLENGAHRYGDIDVHDPAILRLRATDRIVDLHTVDTCLNGDFAFPMIARGRLLGVLVLGRKRSGEHYTPDEIIAVSKIAVSVAAALDILSIKGDDISALSNRIDELAKKIDTLTSR